MQPRCSPSACCECGSFPFPWAMAAVAPIISRSSIGFNPTPCSGYRSPLSPELVVATQLLDVTGNPNLVCDSFSSTICQISSYELHKWTFSSQVHATLLFIQLSCSVSWSPTLVATVCGYLLFGDTYPNDSISTIAAKTVSWLQISSSDLQGSCLRFKITIAQTQNCKLTAILHILINFSIPCF